MIHVGQSPQRPKNVLLKWIKQETYRKGGGGEPVYLFSDGKVLAHYI